MNLKPVEESPNDQHKKYSVFEDLRIGLIAYYLTVWLHHKWKTNWNFKTALILKMTTMRPILFLEIWRAIPSDNKRFHPSIPSNAYRLLRSIPLKKLGSSILHTLKYRIIVHPYLISFWKLFQPPMIVLTPRLLSYRTISAPPIYSHPLPRLFGTREYLIIKLAKIRALCALIRTIKGSYHETFSDFFTILIPHDHWLRSPLDFANNHQDWMMSNSHRLSS